jgi:hypothetical protein
MYSSLHDFNNKRRSRTELGANFFRRITTCLCLHGIQCVRVQGQHFQKFLKVKWFYVFRAAMSDSHRENFVVFGDESCSYVRQAGSSSYVVIYRCI